MTKFLPQILVLLSLLLQQCAQVGPLTGGKRDVTPPVLIDAVPLNRTTNFSGDEIILRFDEFVQVKELNNQLIISPKIKTTPEITAEGKNIMISLKKEELKPNTTYRFYFGKAIADMHESNSIPEFEYVFSTGAFIDTLQLTGTVFDSYNNKPVGNVLIGLYSKTSSDSVAYKETPDYFTRSSENGDFKLKNLPASDYKVIGVADKNKNGLYDGETEKIAFPPEELSLRSDSVLNLLLFQEEAPKVFLKKTTSPYYGLTQLIFNKRAVISATPLRAADSALIHEPRKGLEKDTLSLYYKTIEDTLDIILTIPSMNLTDTLTIQLPVDKPGKRKLRALKVNTQGNLLALGDSLKISFPSWMDTNKVNLKRIKITGKDDSTIINTPAKGYWIDIRTFHPVIKLKEGHPYTMKIDTGAFFDVKGTTNDSSVSNFRTQGRLDFGKVILKLRLNKKQDYIVQLVNEQQQVIKETTLQFSLSSSNAVTVDFTDVLPGTYLVKIIFDDNKNKKWDTGSLFKKQQPEKVIINSKQLKVLSDWEIEEEILIKD